MEDRFNEVMSYIPILFCFMSFLGDNKMLLTFSRHYMMHNVSYVVLCAEVTCKRYFVSNKVKNEIKY